MEHRTSANLSALLNDSPPLEHSFLDAASIHACPISLCLHPSTSEQRTLTRLHPAETTGREFNTVNRQLPGVSDEHPEKASRISKSDGSHSAKRSRATAFPLAEVLNSASPKSATRDVETQEPPSRRRKLDGDGTRILPRPEPSTGKEEKPQRSHPQLPPVLAPINEPAPDARVIPSLTSMTSERFNGARLGNKPSPRAKPKSGPKAASPHKREQDGQNQSIEKMNKQPKQDLESRADVQREKRRKNKWSEQETKHLLEGVKRFGIGSWKKILNHPEFTFNDRNAVDLKDRFRTCCPEEYKRSGTGFTSVESVLDEVLVDSSGPRKDANNRGKGPEELARLGIIGPFPKRQRRQRREFTKEEDDALWRGFLKHRAQWVKIRSDPDLGLAHRSRTDLRDRFRNRFPERFKEVGYKFRHKHDHRLDVGGQDSTRSTTPDKDLSSKEPSIPSNFESIDPILIDSPSEMPSSSYKEVPHTIRLLTSSIPNLFYPEFNEEDPANITLSRNIFPLQNPKSASKDLGQPLFEQKTLSPLDQLLINPLAVQEKLPSSAGLPSVRTDIPNLFPSLPIHGLLNGPVSLPRIEIDGWTE